MLQRYFSYGLCLLLLLVATSCTRRISPNTYSAASVGEASQTFRGTVIGLRQVEVKEAERLQDNSLGMGVGALAGGALGSQVGSGHSAGVVGAVVGALAGGTAGTYLQDSMGTQEAIEYTVQLTNGRVMTVVQGPENALSVGQRVFVMISHEGRSRVVPDNSAPQAPAHTYHQQAAYAPPQQHPYAQQAPHAQAYHQAHPQQQQHIPPQQSAQYPAHHGQQNHYAQQPEYDVPQPHIVYHK